MIKWIKNLCKSERLRAAELRIRELEAENFDNDCAISLLRKRIQTLEKQLAELEDAFIPNIPDDVQVAADKS